MNEIQATKLSTFIVEHFNNRLLIYNDGVDCWEIDNDKSNCDFWIAYNEFTDGSLQIGVNMKFAYNKFSDCPIVCEFPETEEDVFVVRGVFSTGVLNYDESTLYMALSKAQAMTGVRDHISTIIVLTDNNQMANHVAETLRGENYHAVTWEEMNAIILEAIQTGMSFYVIMYGIVILVVAVIITNTLLMSVFERTRELGILSALGMKGRQIMTMILLEASALAILGIILGIVIGSIGVLYLSVAGIPIGDAVAGVAQGFAIRNVLYTKFVPDQIMGLSIAMLVIVLLGALYPASFAARLEPADALHAL